jgi:hypothetical protein
MTMLRNHEGKGTTLETLGMNERIKNFLVVCGMPNEQIFAILEDRKQTRYIQNFAELIIKECLDEIESKRLSGGNRDSWTITRDLCYLEIIHEIKQHFGIKE